MKKIIAAAAGLMLTGAMISTATAAIEFSGDARARYYFQSDYDFGAGATDSEEDHWNSRVRLKIKGTTAGGAWAFMQLTAANSWGAGAVDAAYSDNTLDADYAYIGVPLGCVTLTAGRMNLSLTTGFHNDTDYDAARLDWSNDNTTIAGFYSVVDSAYAGTAGVAAGFELNTPVADGDNAQWDATAATAAVNPRQAEDRLWGAALIQKLNDDWTMVVAGTYLQLDLAPTSDTTMDSGFAGVVAGTGVAGPVALHAELGYQEDGVGASDDNILTEMTGDDGYGGFVTAGMDFDAVNVTFVGGFAMDGYVFDLPVGFVMLGGDTMITVGSTAALGSVAGAAVDTYFAGFKTSYQASEALGLGFNLAYANLEGSDGGVLANTTDTDAYEVSATATYAISDGTVLKSYLGLLDIDEADDAALGFGMSLELSF